MQGDVQTSIVSLSPQLELDDASPLLEHLFNDDWQNLPSSVSHNFTPHMQLAGLFKAPLILVQTLSTQHDITIFSSCQAPELYALIGVGDGVESSGVVPLFIQ